MNSTSDSEDIPNEEDYVFKSSTGSKKPSKKTQKNSKFIKNYQCKYCCRLFTTAFSAKRHHKVCPKSPLLHKMPIKNQQSFQCHVCGKFFRHFEYMIKHAESCSGSSLIRSVPCLYETCSQMFYHKTSLIQHLKFQHNANIEERRNLKFMNIKSFLAWKQEEEQETFSYFSKRMGEKNNVTFYYCQQDGSSKPHIKQEAVYRSTNKRNLKGQIRKGRTCLARIRAKVQKDSTVVVQYDPTHSHPLHPHDLKHHPLSDSLNKRILEQLEIGETPEEIAQSLVNDDSQVEGSFYQLNYVNLVSRIKERVRKMRIKSRSDPDDGTSLMKKVNQLQHHNNCPIIIFKPNGMDTLIGPDIINKIEDCQNVFMMGIQTEQQLEIMKARSDLVSVDLIDGTNRYGYQLLSIVVPDELGRSFPVGFFIASRMDEETISCFARAIKERAPNMEIGDIITSDNMFIITGLNQGFQSELNHILCQWVIYEDVRKKLKKLTMPIQWKAMFKELCSIFDYENKENFVNAFDAFQGKYRKEAPKLFDCIEKYSCNIHKWARCYRRFPRSNINTIMLNESVKNILRIMYMKRIPTKRLDNLIDILLKMSNDFHTRLEKEKVFNVPYGLDDPNKDRHEEGMSISDYDVLEIIENKEWEIASKMYKGQVYKILRLTEICQSDSCYTCPSSCYSLCTHLYFCTCEDLCVLCKHIHKVHSMITKDIPNMEDEDVELIELRFYVDSDCDISLPESEDDDEKKSVPQLIGACESYRIEQNNEINCWEHLNEKKYSRSAYDKIFEEIVDDPDVIDSNTG
ncbi:hypothetical protein HHI36_020138 [Cryptolaemus montrouzieri]|uniref:C2H2-type domain-containing protein n=1 Tax=Cryptolaemus montrouzieri TaxID=559131 RepID=A0ABD2N9L5_9CUCU